MAKKKVISTWKDKKPYQVISPEIFDSQDIGVTISSDPQKLIGRTRNVTLGELVKERSKNYLNLVFEITDVKGDKAHTKFKKFFIPIGYLRSKVRKRTKKISYVEDPVIGGERIRLKIMVLSRYKVSSIQKTQIKGKIDAIVASHTDDALMKFVQQILFGKLGTEIYKHIKEVCPIMRVEVYQVEVLTSK